VATAKVRRAAAFGVEARVTAATEVGLAGLWGSWDKEGPP
jgi:hypothetical protein